MIDFPTRNPPPWVFIAVALGAIVIANEIWGRQLLLYGKSFGAFGPLVVLGCATVGHFLSLLLAPLLFVTILLAPLAGLRVHFDSMTLALSFASLGFWAGVVCIYLSTHAAHARFRASLFCFGSMLALLSTIVYTGYSIYPVVTELEDVAASYNAFEAILWITVGIFFILRARLLEHRLRKLALTSGITFFLFGASDAVEIRTGAWWSPWWLLIWKLTCILSFSTIYLRFRKISNPTASTIKPPIAQ